MAKETEGRISQEVLDRVDISMDKESETWGALQAYEKHVGNPEEPMYRKRFARLYCELVPRDSDGIVTPRERAALERCAEGEPYAE